MNKSNTIRTKRLTRELMMKRYSQGRTWMKNTTSQRKHLKVNCIKELHSRASQSLVLILGFKNYGNSLKKTISKCISRNWRLENLKSKSFKLSKTEVLSPKTTKQMTNSLVRSTLACLTNTCLKTIQATYKWLWKCKMSTNWTQMDNIFMKIICRISKKMTAT